MQMIKKPLSILLSLILVFSVFTVVPVATAGAATYTAAFSGRSDTKTATYIDESGEEQTVTATILGGTEQYEYYDQTFTYFLGEEGQTTWYVVEDDVIYDESLDAPIRIKGNVNLIIEDGASLKADYLSTPHTDESRSLTVYGQTEQSGAFTVDYVDRFYQFDALNIYGATNTFGSVTRVAKMNVKRGTLSVSGSVAVETVTLGCATENDSITIGAIHEDCESVSIEDGQTLIDDIREYTGVLTADDIAAMAGKTLVKAHSHSVNTLTHHAAVAPTYNSAVNTYTGGTVEHYDCSICGGHFVLEDGQLAEKTDEELVVLYFVFQGNPIPEYTDQCWVLEYNGTDADVIIPDTVPADYPDSTMRGKTVIAVDGNAFKGKSFITSVTAGDALARIYDSAFDGCTSLETVTIGSALDSIGTDAFKDCTALESFTSSSTENITFSHNTDDPEHPQQSFDIGAEVVFRGPHGSKLLEVADYYDTVFSPTDRHVDPIWTWTADYCSATATFACSGCQLDGDEHSAAITRDGTVYTATVTVDGNDYTDTVDVAESAVAKIAPNHYYADFRSAIVAAHDTYDDAVIELLKDTSFTWDLELCKNYPSFKVKRNSHTLNYTAHSCYPVSKTDDSADVVTYTASADHRGMTTRSILNESDGEYSIILYLLCGNCGEKIEETTYEAEKHAAKAATCTETGNIEYYVISEELGSTVITYYYVLADSPEYENEVTCVDGDEIAAVTVPVDPDNHPMPLICHPEVEPTLTSDGNSAYYECSGCHMYFSDATGSIEIPENSWILNKTAVAMIAPDHYYADFRSAIVAAHDDYNDAVIELLKDTTFTWDLELCENYTPFRVKTNGYSLDYILHPCYSIGSTDNTKEIITYSAESYHDDDPDKTYCILEEEAGNYTAAVHMICPICGFDTVLRNDVVKHAAKAATCTETGNIEYYSNFVENGNYSFTRYYVLKDPDQADHENELELLGTDVADVTIPIDPDAHQLTYHPAVEPTFTTEGNIAYWTCDICGKYFSDENGEHEITQAQTVVSSTAVAMIAPDHYYTDFRSAIVAAHDDYNDAIIELLKDTTLSWDLELCQNYTPFRVKMNGHSIDSLSQPPCYAICSTDDTAEIITYSVESYHDDDPDKTYCILEEEAGNYTTAIHMICPICGFDTVLRNDVVKHAAVAPTCTEAGNIEYYSNFVENGNYSFTRYFVLKDPAQAEHENELEFLGTDVADVTVPIDPDAHQLTYHPAVPATIHGEGNIAYWTCDLCGKYFSDGNGEHEITQEETVIPFSIFSKHSLTLHGDIGVNFYLNLSESELSEGVTVSFTLNNELLSTYTINAQRDAITIDGKTYYKATCWVCAPEMADTITAEIKFNGETVAIEDYSVKTYGDTILNDEDAIGKYKQSLVANDLTEQEAEAKYEKLAALVTAMLGYGGAAQVQFADEHPNNEVMANDGLDAPAALSDDEYNDIMSAPDKPDKASINTIISGSGLTYYGYTMLLHSKTKLRFYFQKDSKDTDYSGIHLTLGGTTYNAENYNDWFCYVEVPEIPAYELNNVYTLSVNGTELGSYSALTYVKDVLTDSSADAVLVDTVTAMYRYHKAAVTWFNSQNNNQGGN